MQLVSQTCRHVPSTQVYQFVDRNNWPISVEQEAQLTVMDILSSSYVCIREYGYDEISPTRETSPCEKQGLPFENKCVSWIVTRIYWKL